MPYRCRTGSSIDGTTLPWLSHASHSLFGASCRSKPSHLLQEKLNAMLPVLTLFPPVLLFVSSGLSYNLTAPVQNEIIDSTKPFMVKWIPAQ
jgi:hypothetical protein